jgi:hypothetical protein
MDKRFMTTLISTRRCGSSPNYKHEKDDGKVDDGGEAHGIMSW